MFKRELLIIATLVTALVLAATFVGWYAIWKLHQTSNLIVTDTLPGLADAGLAGERMNDNRRMMHDLLAPQTIGERKLLISQIKANSTDALWRDYADSIFENEDRRNYQAMMLVRSNYLQGCEVFYGMVAAEKMSAAEAYYNGELGQRFKAYNLAAKNLFDYNVKQGIKRGKALMLATSFAPWLIVGFCLLVFLGGLVLGIRSNLSGVA